MTSPPAKSYSLKYADRLHGVRQFQAVFHARMKKGAGPFSLWTFPNEMGYWRLGLSTPGKVGIAVKRNRIKRLIREAFRLTRGDWPGAYDAVVVIHPHPPLKLAEYQELLRGAVNGAHQEWQRRKNRSTGLGGQG